MRLRVPALLLAFAGMPACGDDQAGPTVCEVGPEIYSEALSKLLASSPACSSDSECVTIFTGIACSSIGIGSCGTVVHKAVANDWDEKAVCRQIEHAAQPSRPRGTYCQTEASCAAIRAACVANTCAGVSL